MCGVRCIVDAGWGLAGSLRVRPGGTLRAVPPSTTAAGISVRASPPPLQASPGLGSTNVLWRARGAVARHRPVFCAAKAFSMPGAPPVAAGKSESRSVSEAGRVEGRAEWVEDGGQAAGRGTV